VIEEDQMRIALSARARDADAVSEFEQMAADTAFVSRRRQAMLGILLDATLPMTSRGHQAFRPLWVNEAMHRAYKMIRLTAALQQLVPLCRSEPMVDEVERSIATGFATIFRSLDVDDDDDVMPCSEDLRTAVCGLIELFAPVAGSACFRADIERLRLPGFKRRALVLAACELVSDVLLRGFIQSAPGDIQVVLRKAGATEMRLTVSSSAFDTIPDRPSDSLSDLAALLECNVTYSMLHMGGVAAELTFPIVGPNCGFECSARGFSFGDDA
jgi:hypothetical protein